jgi:putative nucleotidyltransferase with HDIG domain
MKANETFVLVETIPALSAKLYELVRAMSDTKVSIADIAALVDQDPILAARVLKIANSTAFSPRNPIETTQRAVGYVGGATVISIAMKQGAPHIFSKALAGYSTNTQELWEHSLLTAIAAREIAHASKKDIPVGLAYTAGLLHDLGKVVLAINLGNYSDLLIEKIDSLEKQDFLIAERHFLETDHCEVGAKLAEHWKLPDVFKQIMTHHHYPSDGPEEFKELLYVVHMADLTAMLLGSGTGVDTMYYSADPLAAEYVNISNKKYGKVMIKTADQYQKIIEAMQ